MLRDFLSDHAPENSHSSSILTSAASFLQADVHSFSAPSPDITAGHSTPAAESLLSMPVRLPQGTQTPAAAVPSVAAASVTNGDKSMAKLAHHASEIKKEIENAAKTRRDSNIEIQRLREKCHALEEKVSAERIKVASLEERLEKSQLRQRNMAVQIETLQQAAMVPVSASQNQPASPLKPAKPAGSTPVQGSGSVFESFLSPDIGISQWNVAQTSQKINPDPGSSSVVVPSAGAFASVSLPQTQQRTHIPTMAVPVPPHSVQGGSHSNAPLIGTLVSGYPSGPVSGGMGNGSSHGNSSASQYVYSRTTS